MTSLRRTLTAAITGLTMATSTLAAQPQDAGKAFALTDTRLDAYADDYCNTEAPGDGECYEHMKGETAAVGLMRETCEPEAAQEARLLKRKDTRGLTGLYDGVTQCYRSFVAANRDNAYADPAFELGINAMSRMEAARRGDLKTVRRLSPE